MYPECFESYYKSQCQKILGNYKLSTDYFDEEGIHDLRVEIKRLRAFFNVVAWINPDFRAKFQFREIQRLFKAAGKIRDVHVQQALVKDWVAESKAVVDEYYNFLKQRELENRKEVAKYFGKFDTAVLDSKWRTIAASLVNFDVDYIEFKTRQRFNFLVDDLVYFKNKDNLAEEDFHQIRILSKETRYVLEILLRCFPSEDAFRQINNSLRAVHQALGNWHDNSVGLQYLECMLEENAGLSFDGNDAYERYANVLEKGRQAWLTKFERRWRKFVRVTSGRAGVASP